MFLNKIMKNISKYLGCFEYVQGTSKALFDYGLALALLPILLPVMGVVWLMVCVSSRGPVIFCQLRIGRYGKPFTIYKFRTLYHERSDEQVWVRAGDSSVTPVGKYLRMTHLDELPQIFNVLKGDMSIIGPRPHSLPAAEYYRQCHSGYDVRSRVKPGITGLEQSHRPDGIAVETPAAVWRRVCLDIEYVCNWSLACDLDILIKTAGRFFYDLLCQARVGHAISFVQRYVKLFYLRLRRSSPVVSTHP